MGPLVRNFLGSGLGSTPQFFSSQGPPGLEVRVVLTHSCPVKLTRIWRIVKQPLSSMSDLKYKFPFGELDFPK